MPDHENLIPSESEESRSRGENRDRMTAAIETCPGR